MVIDTAFLVTKTIAEVKLAYAKAVFFVLGVPTTQFISTLGVSTAYSALKRAVGGVDETRGDVQNLYTLGKSIDVWVSRAPEALSGKNPNFPLTQWVLVGQNIATDAATQANESINSSFFAQAFSDAKVAAQTTIDALKKVAQPTQWPWYAQVAVGGVAIFYLSQIYRNFRGK